MTLHKVTAFITRGFGTEAELLVIDHPDAGVQLPAGTVEPDESPQTAVFREVKEEAGLEAVKLVQTLTSFSQLQGDERVMTQTVPLQTRPAAEAPTVDVPSALHTLHRGWLVREVTRQRNQVQVCYEERSYEGNTPGPVVLSWEGWVAATAVTEDLVRHLYHLRPTRPLPDSWFADPGDHGHPPWRLFWLPLATADLVPPQQSWLARAREALWRWLADKQD